MKKQTHSWTSERPEKISTKTENPNILIAIHIDTW